MDGQSGDLAERKRRILLSMFLKPDIKRENLHVMRCSYIAVGVPTTHETFTACESDYSHKREKSAWLHNACLVTLLSGRPLMFFVVQ